MARFNSQTVAADPVEAAGVLHLLQAGLPVRAQAERHVAGPNAPLPVVRERSSVLPFMVASKDTLATPPRAADDGLSSSDATAAVAAVSTMRA